MSAYGFDDKKGPARPSLIASIAYRDPKRMYRWLEDAFGFEPYGIILDAQGELMHSEMTFGDSSVMVGSEWADISRSPLAVGGFNTQRMHVHLTEDIASHCERARTAGAEILAEPETQFYGDRTYRARDPEGHVWTFAQTVKVVSPAEWDASLGVSTYKRLPE